MTIYDNKYYIKRIGDFATNGNKKIIYSLFSILLCFDDYVNNHSYDCFRIMLGSTFVWTLIEIYLNISKTRVIYTLEDLKYHGSFGLSCSSFTAKFSIRSIHS
jgi:hypothetical protein